LTNLVVDKARPLRRRYARDFAEIMDSKGLDLAIADMPG
jgi:hypothetical protein